MTCACGHVDDEHGGDEVFPGSSACTIDGCDCVLFENDPDQEHKETSMAREDAPPRKLKRELPVELTDDELKKKGKKAGHLKKKIAVIRAEMKAAVSGHKDKLKEHQAELDSILDDLDAGTEDRKVDCHEVKDFNRRERRIVRLDTDEVVERVTMGAEELQETFPGADPEDGEPSEPDEPEEQPEPPKRGRKKKS